MRGMAMSSTKIGVAAACLGLAVSCGGVDAEEPGEANDATLEEAPVEPEPAKESVASGFVDVAPPRPKAVEQVEPPAPAPVEVAESRPISSKAPAGGPSSPAPTKLSMEAQADAYLAGGDYPAAAGQYSALMMAEISSGEEPDQAALDRWKIGLDEAQSRFRWSRGAGWNSVSERVRPGDSLIAIRKRVLEEHPDILLCTGLIQRVNQLRSSTAIRPDDELRVPLERPRVVISLRARWAFYFLGDEVAAAWRVGIGKDESATPPGRYTIKDKQENPPWHPPGREMVAFGDPENPLGTRWMSWDDENGWHSTLGFHGTNDESGVGLPVSQGCIRMRNADVEELFEILPVGSEVLVQP